MNGQLWQECRCGTEPVCCDCERCNRHCRCAVAELRPPISAPAPDEYRRGIGAGFGATDDGDAE